MGPIVVLIIVATVVFIVMALLFNERARMHRALRKAPRRRIGDVVEGAVVRIDGVVAPGELLYAPLTGRPCVFYEALIEEYVSNGKSGSWRGRVREARGVPFVLEDGTGRAVVDPNVAKVDVELDSTTRSGTLDDPTPIEHAFLARHQMKGTGWVFNRSLRYREGVIEVGERIAVMGRPIREPDRDAVAQVSGYRDALPTRVRLGGAADQPLLLSDARTLAD